MALSQLGYRNIEVWDKRSHPQPSSDSYWGRVDRSYNIGVVERGQAVLHRLGMLQRLGTCATPMITRAQWSPQNREGTRYAVNSDPKKRATSVV
jgi:hypothetical protein